jgi:hypothetical protein
MITDINSEDRLVQKTFADHLSARANRLLRSSRA